MSLLAPYSGASGQDHVPFESADSRNTRTGTRHGHGTSNKLTAKYLYGRIHSLENTANQYRLSRKAGFAVESQREAGDIYFMLGQYQSAVGDYKIALNLAEGNQTASCRVRAHLIRAYANQGELSKAREFLDQARGDKCLEDDKVAADLLEAEGETLFWSGARAEAIDPLTQAREGFAKAGDHDGEALSLLMLANSKVGSPEKSDRDEAPGLARQALRLSSDAGNNYWVARAQMSLAFMAAAAGDFELAQCNCDESLSVFQTMRDQDDGAIILNISGKLARETGDIEKSLEFYRKAKAVFASLNDREGEAEAITGMAAALKSLKRYQPLLSLYSQKLRLARQAGNPSLVASAIMDLAGLHQMRREYGKAAILYQQALKKYRSMDLRYGEGDVLIRMALMSVAQGKATEAVTLLKDALQLKESTAQIEDVARIHFEIARIYREQHRLSDARAEAEKTIQIIESQRLRIARFDSRAQYFASVHQYYSLYIQILMALYDLNSEPQFRQLAFEASERSKVRSLIDLLASSGQSSPCPGLLAKQIDSAPDRIQDGREKEPVSSTQALTLQEIQEGIVDPETLLVEYALGDEKSYAWVIARDKIASFELPSEAQLRKLALGFRKDLVPLEPRRNETVSEYYGRKARAAQGYLQRSRALARLLIGAVNPRPGQRILIVPDGPLQYIPFSALPSPDSANDQTTFLAQHDLISVPSASALAAMRKAAAKRAPPTAGIAIFADPVFEHGQQQSGPYLNTVNPDTRQVLNRALRDIKRSQHIARLPGSRNEAIKIRQIFGSEHTLLALGFNANRAAVINGAVSSFRIIHFATHGIVDSHHPEMSGLILSLINSKGDHQDGYLRLGDIYKLQLSADLVVLSSCESALGRDLQAEGIIGLPRGFLYAGAKRVIATLWKVDDAATAVLMQKMYARIQRGESPPAALREAQLELRRGTQFSEPYYWAAFVLEGDYK
jgi:CHAT domain-containing protein/tetratricopeptide (TPR) repeat protein